MMWIIQTSSLSADFLLPFVKTCNSGRARHFPYLVFTEIAEPRSGCRVPILLPFINRNLMFELVYMPVYANDAPQIMKCIHPRQKPYPQYSSILQHFHDELEAINDWELVICFWNITIFLYFIFLYIHVDLLNINGCRSGTTSWNYFM